MHHHFESGYDSVVTPSIDEIPATSRHGLSFEVVIKKINNSFTQDGRIEGFVPA
jgi:hypothetical protein